MNKIQLFSSLAILIVSVASCQQELENDNAIANVHQHSLQSAPLENSTQPLPGQYTIKFYKNDGSNDVWKTEYHFPKETFILPDPSEELHRDNYVPKKWVMNSPESIEERAIGQEFTMPDHDVNFYISWQVLDISKTGGPFKEFANREVFVYGTRIPSFFTESDQWKYNQDDPTHQDPKTVEWTPDCGWFDSYQNDYNLCWAGSASNMIHWWMWVNRDNIRQYNQIQRAKGAPTFDPEKFSYEGADKDKLFDLFAMKTFEDRGGTPGVALDWFFKGKDSEPAFFFRPTAGEGAFFKDVISKDDHIIETFNNIKKWNLSRIIGNALKAHQALTISSHILGGQHQETIWGARFDKDGYLIGFYSTDSSIITYLSGYKECGLSYWNVGYTENGDAYWFNENFPIHGIGTLSSCKNEWKRYFAKQSVSTGIHPPTVNR